MMGSGMFDGMLTGLILCGVVIGVCLSGVGWFIYWLCCHISIRWVS
jgi:hypothetical protein